jgi:hypothetical protein
MIGATIRNLSTFDRVHWAEVTFPSALVYDYGAECKFITETGEEWRAVRGRTLGNKTVYRIQSSLSGSSSVEGHLHQGVSTSPAFVAHPWVVDDCSDLIPSLLGLDMVPASAPRLVGQSGAHMRWNLKFRIPSKGLVLDWWADMLHEDPVMRCRGKLVWSDRNDARANRTFEPGELQFCMGEFFAMDFRERRGISAPSQLPDGRWVSVLNDRPITLNDGAGIHLSMSVLSYANASPSLDEAWELSSIRNMRAAMVGDVLGACTEWDDHWCAAGNLPQEYPGMESDASSAVSSFADSMSENVGHFEPLGIGIGRTPGQTGKQEDFGAAKGTHVVSSGRADYIPALRYASYCELYRGINHYESDGSRLLASSHPNWTTWSGRTHWHTGVSPDRLGKEGVDVPPGTGWWGYDDQHRSQNTLAAYLMLSDDPLVHDQLEHQKQADLASYRVKFPSYGSGAARAQGRQIGCWAQLYCVTGDDTWKDLILGRVDMGMSGESMSSENEMRALSVISPDGRKRIYKDGALAPVVSMWEHGLALVGLYKAHKQLADPALAEMVYAVSETMMKFAWFEESGRVYVVGDILWNGGSAVTLETSNGWDESGSNPMTQEFLYTEGGSGINAWTMAGLRVAREYLGESHASLDSILDTPVSSREDAEWRAAVES